MHNNRPDQLSDLAVMAPARREKLEGGKRFVLQSPFQPAGDQATAIAELSEGLTTGERNQVCLLYTSPSPRD